MRWVPVSGRGRFAVVVAQVAEPLGTGLVAPVDDLVVIGDDEEVLRAVGCD